MFSPFHMSCFFVSPVACRAADAAQVDEIVLVGGSTRIPKVQQLIKDASSYINFWGPSWWILMNMDFKTYD